MGVKPRFLSCKDIKKFAFKSEKEFKMEEVGLWKTPLSGEKSVLLAAFSVWACAMQFRSVFRQNKLCATMYQIRQTALLTNIIKSRLFISPGAFPAIRRIKF